MITLDNLSVGYTFRRRSTVVAHGLTARCLPGTLTCLTGRNGTGKSTLLRTVARFMPPLAGSVGIMGHDASGYTPAAYARLVGVVLTARPYGRNITVGELVALGRTPYTGFWGTLSAEDRAVVEEAMCLVGISGLAARRVVTLSDGERQKAMVAKALAQQTPVMLLDEPTAFLDYPSKVELMTLLRRLAEERRLTVLVSTHDLDIALRTAHRLWLLGGKGLAEGKPEEMEDALGRVMGMNVFPGDACRP